MSTRKVYPARSLDDAGRCCGRKPIVYKREHFLYCHRCNAAYDLSTKHQKANWAWLAVEGGFLSRYEDGDRIELAEKALAFTSRSFWRSA